MSSSSSNILIPSSTVLITSATTTMSSTSTLPSTTSVALQSTSSQITTTLPSRTSTSTSISTTPTTSSLPVTSAIPTTSTTLPPTTVPVSTTSTTSTTLPPTTVPVSTTSTTPVSSIIPTSAPVEVSTSVVPGATFTSTQAQPTIAPTAAPTQAPTTSFTPTVVTSLFTSTSAGRLVTLTSIVTAIVGVDPTSNGATPGRLSGTAGDSSAGRGGFFNNTGAVAGTFTVVGLVVAIGIAALAWLFFRRRRMKKLNEDIRVAAGGAGDGGAGVDRFSGEEDEDMREMGLFSGSSGVINGAYLPTRERDRMSGEGFLGGNRTSLRSDGSGSHPAQPYYNPGVNPYAVNNYYGTTYGELPYTAVGYSQENLDDGSNGRQRDSSGSGSGENGSREGHYGSRSEEAISNPFTTTIAYPEYAAVNGGAMNRRDSGDSLSQYHSDSRRQTLTQPLSALPPSEGHSSLGLGLANDSLTSLGDEKDYSAKRILRVANPEDD